MMDNPKNHSKEVGENEDKVYFEKPKENVLSHRIIFYEHCWKTQRKDFRGNKFQVHFNVGGGGWRLNKRPFV